MAFMEMECVGHLNHEKRGDLVYQPHCAAERTISSVDSANSSSHHQLFFPPSTLLPTVNSSSHHQLFFLISSPISITMRFQVPTFFLFAAAALVFTPVLAVPVVGSKGVSITTRPA
jgi:hypothetical protein